MGRKKPPAVGRVKKKQDTADTLYEEVVPRALALPWAEQRKFMTRLICESRITCDETIEDYLNRVRLMQLEHAIEKEKEDKKRVEAKLLGRNKGKVSRNARIDELAGQGKAAQEIVDWFMTEGVKMTYATVSSRLYRLNKSNQKRLSDQK